MVAKVTQKDREEHSATHDERFPIKNKSQARSALRLRGHNTSKAQRRAIINRAAKFAPAAAKAAREADEKSGAI
jgi:hypothetical protein